MVDHDPYIERAVHLYNLISGPIFFVTALGVFLMMWFDADRRNVIYRRLIMGLQLAAMGADQMLSLGAVVFMPSEWALYASGLTFNIGIVIWIMLILFFISQILVCWYACLLYCHQQVVPPGSRFRLHPGMPKFFVLGFELAELIVGIFAAKMFMEMLLPDEKISADLSWIKSRQSYGVFQYNDSFIAYGIVITLITPPLGTVGFVMFVQIFFYLRTEKRYTSERTRKAQKSAAITMIMLAAVPAIFLIIPFYGSCANIVVQKLFQGHLGFLESPEVSAALFALANTHSIANSLTIVLRSKKYRRAVALPFRMLARRSRQQHRPSVIRVEDMTSHLFSICADQTLSIGAMVVLTRDFVLYPVGFTFGFSIVGSMMLYMFFVSQIFVCWFASLLYCHQHVQPPASKFRFRSHLFKYVIILMEIGEFTVGICASQSLKHILLSDEQIPAELSWVKTKPTYGVFQINDRFFYFSIAAMIVTPPFLLLVFVLFTQIFYYLRVSMRHTSEVTRRYQKRAAITVLLLGIIPGIFLVIPFYGTIALAVKRAVPFGEYFVFLEVFEAPAVSAALFSFANTHSIANSLTIISRSKSYKRILAVPFIIIFPCFRSHRQSVVHVWEVNSRST